MFPRIILAFCIVFLATVQDLQAQPPLKEPDRARRIAAMMIDRNDGQSVYRNLILVTCDFVLKSGTRTCASRPIKKSIESLSLDVGENREDTLSLGIISDPPSEKNTAFLQKDYDQDGKESDQWMYFPALKKLKRIISQNENSPKTGTVFGSEVSYEDIEKMHLSNYRYSYEGTEAVDNRTCDIIKAFPTENQAPKTSYSQEIYWIDRKTGIPLKRDLCDQSGRHVKTYYSKDIQEINGVWVFKVRIVVNHESHVMSMEKTNEMAVNIPIEEELLGMRALKDVSYRESRLKEIRSQAR